MEESIKTFSPNIAEGIRVITANEKGVIAAEFRNMKVGEVIAFPMEYHNPLSVRNTPSTSCYNARRAGMKWMTSTDEDDDCVYVARVK